MSAFYCISKHSSTFKISKDLGQVGSEHAARSSFWHFLCWLSITQDCVGELSLGADLIESVVLVLEAGHELGVDLQSVIVGS